MADSELLDDLLQQWEDLAEAGQELSPAYLCRDCPHLLPELERRVQGRVGLPAERLFDRIRPADRLAGRNARCQPALLVDVAAVGEQRGCVRDQ